MDPGCWCWWHTWFIMKQQIAWWWQPLVLVSLFRNKLKGRGLWMWEAERLRGWEVWNDVTRSLGRNIAVITTITRGRGRGDNHNLMFRVWSNKAGGGDVNWGWAGAGDGVSPGLYLKQNLPSLFVWGHSLSLSVSLSRQFSWLRGHMAPVPLVRSHQCCGHSLHNCHPLITTSGDTFHRLGHLNRESVRYPVILFYDNCR